MVIKLKPGGAFNDGAECVSGGGACWGLGCPTTVPIKATDCDDITAGSSGDEI